MISDNVDAGQAALIQSVEEIIGRAEQLREQGLAAQIIPLYQAWLAENNPPLAYVIWFNLGVALAGGGEYPQAMAAYQRAIVLRRDFLPARFNLGSMLEKQGQPSEALAVWREILSLSPQDLANDTATRILTLNNLGRLLEIHHRYAEAEASLHESLRLDSAQADVIQHWLHLRQKQCSWPILATWPGGYAERAWMNASALSTLAYTDDPEIQKAAARRYIESHTKPSPPRSPPAARPGYRHERLRIGYLSGDFCRHPVGMLLIGLLERHNRERFQIYGYCWSPEDGSGVRQRLIAAMDHFVPIRDIDDVAAAEMIRADEIDILIDLQGLTSGARPNLLSHRLAPLQISWLGFPGTSGHPEIDYLLVDRYVVPPGYAHAYSETPLYLPQCFQPSDPLRDVAPALVRKDLGLPETGFVFCCFNNNYKITAQLFAAWMRILSRVPGSVLWLLADSSWAREHLQAAAESHGVDSNRLVFSERVAPPVYLARYRLADLFLDTTPFNAGTTANDALWMGLPLLTLSGQAFASRMAGSLLHTLGLDELITTSLEAYEDRAIGIALAPGRSAQLRCAIETARNVSPLFNMAAFARDLEALYEEVFAWTPMLPPGTGSRCFLHVGCGKLGKKDTLPIFNDDNWNEIRLDIDPAAKPDIVASMTDLGALSSATVDAVFSSHNIEHLYPHEVRLALCEFNRVLKPDGFIVITCPDLHSVCAQVVQKGLTATAYLSPAGPIAALDMLYGYRMAVERGQTSMAHRTGFTRESLEVELRNAGFIAISVINRPEHFDLWAVATKSSISPKQFSELTRRLIHG